MILYFSATGNSEFAAKLIAQATDDKAVSLTKIKGVLSLSSGENLGIVTPVYYWGLPAIVEEFLDKIKFENAEKSYVYYVATYGGTVGQADYFVKESLKKKGVNLSASFGVLTVDNWTVGFSVNDKEEIARILDGERVQIDDIIEQIKIKKSAYIDRDRKSVYMCKKARYFYKKARQTKYLRVLHGCIGCGLCEKGCAESAILMVNGKPKWVKDKCSMCFKCLHRCPKFAIHYKNKTKKNGQYMHP